jgi:hypothetical protein
MPAAAFWSVFILLSVFALMPAVRAWRFSSKAWSADYVVDRWRSMAHHRATGKIIDLARRNWRVHLTFVFLIAAFAVTRPLLGSSWAADAVLLVALAAVVVMVRRASPMTQRLRRSYRKVVGADPSVVIERGRAPSDRSMQGLAS